MAANRILVTGAFGLVGSAVIAELRAQGRSVIATDVDTPANRQRAQQLSRRWLFDTRWADLTSSDEVAALVAETVPSPIVHLAALIPPFCYANRGLAHAVNVGATGALVSAAALDPAPRFVLASSVAVFGVRNPYRGHGLLTAETPVDPIDLYGAHKVAAEDLVTQSALDWVVLRLGGVMTATPRWTVDPNLLRFKAALPSDGRIQTVDVRDVARAFDAATQTPHVGEVFLIGGDETPRTTQACVAAGAAAAMGLVGGFPPGRPGDPERDLSWFVTDWTDTECSQNVLAFQRYSLPAMHAETRAAVGERSCPVRLAAPIVRASLQRQSPYRRIGGAFADPWRAVELCWGNPQPN